MTPPVSLASPARENSLLLLRLACLSALAASSALAVDYRSAESSFCGAESGCGVLRATELAHLWGLGPTLPELGLLAFVAVYGLSLTRWARGAAVLAVGGGVAGLGLLAAQALDFGTFCWLCVVVDLSALAAGVSAVWALKAWPRRAPPVPERAGLHVGAWVGLLLLAIAGPAVWPWVKPSPPVPPAIRAYYEPGKINVIEFADFQCPFCRRLHQELKTLLAPYGDRVNFVRLNMPLKRHPQARDAALAAICAESSGRADELVEFLFAADDLSLPVIRDKAATLGIDPAKLESCRAAPETLARLERESQILHQVGFQGLPTTYIGGTRIVGAQSPETFRDALERAARKGSEPGIPPWAYLFLLAAIAAAIVQAGRTGSRGAPSRAEAPAG
ncbi:MAG TPA: thioredoxin domain-containing protein [Polyangiaceae bacterium]